MKVDLAFVAAILKYLSFSGVENNSIARTRRDSGVETRKTGRVVFSSDGALVIIPTEGLSLQTRIFGTFGARHFLQRCGILICLSQNSAHKEIFGKIFDG